MNVDLLAAAKALPLSERVEFAEALWRSIAHDEQCAGIGPHLVEKEIPNREDISVEVAEDGLPFIRARGGKITAELVKEIETQIF